jgi:predicted O-methyltransferase YrrM
VDSYISSWQQDAKFVSLFNQFNILAGINNEINNSLYARLYILRQLATQQKDKGNFAECGVYAGMSMFFVADLCKNKFIGVDSFEGVSEPGEYDSDYFKSKKLSISISFAEKILKNFDNVDLYKGWIPEVFDKLNDEQYSYVNIDVDLYDPTKNSIEYFWPRLIKGGVLICDDYGSDKTPGARKAMNDFFGVDNILELPTGQALVYKI